MKSSSNRMVLSSHDGNEEEKTKDIGDSNPPAISETTTTSTTLLSNEAAICTVNLATPSSISPLQKIDDQEINEDTTVTDKSSSPSDSKEIKNPTVVDPKTLKNTDRVVDVSDVVVTKVKPTTNTNNNNSNDNACNDDTTVTDKSSSPEDKRNEITNIDAEHLRKKDNNDTDNKDKKIAHKVNESCISSPKNKAIIITGEQYVARKPDAEKSKIVDRSMEPPRMHRSPPITAHKSNDTCVPLPKNIITGEKCVARKPDSESSAKSNENKITKLECIHKKNHEAFNTDDLKMECDNKWIDKRQLLANAKCSKCKKYLVKNMRKAVDAENCTLFTTTSPIYCCEVYLTNGPCNFVLCSLCHSELIIKESGITSIRRRTRTSNKKK